MSTIDKLIEYHEGYHRTCLQVLDADSPPLSKDARDHWSSEAIMARDTLAYLHVFKRRKSELKQFQAAK